MSFILQFLAHFQCNFLQLQICSLLSHARVYAYALKHLLLHDFVSLCGRYAAWFVMKTSRWMQTDAKSFIISTDCFRSLMQFLVAKKKEETGIKNYRPFNLFYKQPTSNVRWKFNLEQKELYFPSLSLFTSSRGRFLVAKVSPKQMVIWQFAASHVIITNWR